MGLILLQMALSLLLMAQQVPNMPPELMTQVNELVNTAIQMASNVPTESPITNTIQGTTITTTITPTQPIPPTQPIIINNEPMNQPLGAAETLKPAYSTDDFFINLSSLGYPDSIAMKGSAFPLAGVEYGPDAKVNEQRKLDSDNFLKTLTWENYLDGILVKTLTNRYTSVFSQSDVETLSSGNHTWKVILKQEGREDTKFEGTFTK